jgi:hypothetical protein
MYIIYRDAYRDTDVRYRDISRYDNFGDTHHNDHLHSISENIQHSPYNNVFLLRDAKCFTKPELAIAPIQIALPNKCCQFKYQLFTLQSQMYQSSYDVASTRNIMNNSLMVINAWHGRPAWSPHQCPYRYRNLLQEHWQYGNSFLEQGANLIANLHGALIYWSRPLTYPRLLLATAYHYMRDAARKHTMFTCTYFMHSELISSKYEVLLRIRVGIYLMAKYTTAER